MKKNTIILFIVFLNLNVKNTFSQKAQLSTKWHSEKYDTIENVSNMDFLYDSEEKLLFLLTNDEENFYLHLRTISEMPERKLINFGFSIEIKIKGDKTKRIVEYPLPKEERMKPVILVANNSEERRKDFKLIKEQVIKQIYKMRLTGFSDDVSTVKVSENEFNISGNLNINKNGQLQYMVTIPLKTLGLSIANDVSMNVTLKSGSMEIDSNQGPSSNVDGIGGIDQRSGGRQVGQGQSGMGQQGMPQVNRGGQQANMGASMPQGPIERHPMSKAINIKIKNLMLLKKTDSF